MYDLKTKLPAVLRANPFWTDFLDVVSDELNEIHEFNAAVQAMFNLGSDDITEEDLIEAAQFLGYTPDRSIDDSLSRLREEVRAIVFRVLFKSSLTGYTYIFKSLPYPGEVFILFNIADGSTNKLIRAFEDTAWFNTLSGLQVGDLVHLPSEDNYSKFLADFIYFDSNIYFDSVNTPWFLDASTTSRATKHIAIEYSIDKLLESDGQEFLMTPLYLNYLLSAANYNRKVTEVPHVGAQFTIINDDSGQLPSSGFTQETLKIKSVVTNNFDPAIPASDQFYSLRIGIGSHSTIDSSISELDISINAVEFKQEEIDQRTGQKIAHSMIDTNAFANFYIGTGDGDVFDISDELSVVAQTEDTQLIPNTMRMYFRELGTRRTIVDLGGELFVEGNDDNLPVGEIDYDTGEYTLRTEIYPPHEVTFSESDIVYDSDADRYYLPIDLSDTPIRPNSMTLTFTTSTTQEINDTETGNEARFSGVGLQDNDSYINYTTGEGEIVFDGDSVATDSTITLEYESILQFLVDDGTDITAEFSIEGTVDITEAGIVNEEGELVCYATFPPYRTDLNAYHMSIQWVVLTS